jgi:hypothetical protein
MMRAYVEEKEFFSNDRQYPYVVREKIVEVILLYNCCE